MSDDLTPVEARDGHLWKREDLYTGRGGVNGAKYRQSALLVERAARSGRIVTGASVNSPQHAIVASRAADLGVPVLSVVGGSKPNTALKHASVRIALELGATLDTSCRVAYNTAIQARVRTLARETGAGVVPYALSLPERHSREDALAFHTPGADQTRNLPRDLDTLVVPFGSGNSAASILYGLARDGWSPRRIVLAQIGPSRLRFLYERLGTLGRTRRPVGSLPVEVVDLTRRYRYEQKVRRVEDGIRLHPNYEAKVVESLERDPRIAPGWAARDESTLLYVVGGPL